MPLKHALVVSYVTVAAEPAEVHSLTVRAWAEAARATSAAASVRICEDEPTTSQPASWQALAWRRPLGQAVEET